MSGWIPATAAAITSPTTPPADRVSGPSPHPHAPTRIEKTIGTRADLGDGTAAARPDSVRAALLTRLRELSALGFDHVMLAPTVPWTAARIDTVASILPEVRALAG